MNRQHKGELTQEGVNVFNRMFGVVKGQTIQHADSAKHGIDNRIETLMANIKAKESIEDLYNEDITKEELAFSLSKDVAMRRAMDKVTEGMINPDPIKVLDRAPVAFDVSHGMSVFWKELNAPIEERMNLAVEIKEMNDRADEGMNPGNSPTARRRILSDLGIEGEQMNVLVTQEDDVLYQKKVVDHYRNEHMERLGLKDKDILDPADEELLDHLVEDSLAMPDGFRIDIVREGPMNKSLIDPYEETFGLSAEEFIEAYALDDGYNRYDYPPFDELDRIDDFPSMKYALEEYERLHGVTLEENIHELEEIQEIQSVVNQTKLDDHDLMDLDHPTQGQLYEDHQAPPENNDPIVPIELSEDDLRNLSDWDDLQY